MLELLVMQLCTVMIVQKGGKDKKRYIGYLFISRLNQPVEFKIIYFEFNIIISLLGLAYFHAIDLA